MKRSAFVRATTAALAGAAPLAALAESTTVASWEDGLRTDAAPHTLEFWYFDTLMDDGTTAGFNFFTRAPGVLDGPLAPQVSINIGPPHGARTREVLRFAPGECSFARDRCDVRIGPNRAGGALVDGVGKRYHVDVVGKESAAHLVFSGEVPAWRPAAPDTQLRPGITFAWQPFIPYGRVTGTLAYGGKTHAVRGSCYHDHNWMNVNMNTIVDRWYWGRANTANYHLVFTQLFGRGAIAGAPISTLLVARRNAIELGVYGQGIPLTLTTADIATGYGGRTYPRALDFAWKGARGQVHLALRNPRFIEWFPLPPNAVLGDTNPWYYRWIADVALSVDLDKRRTSEHGTAIYEQLLLH